jgi:hypothetical protein
MLTLGHGTPMTTPFRAPEPVAGERHDNYLRRLTEAFENWANDQMASMTARVLSFNAGPIQWPDWPGYTTALAEITPTAGDQFTGEFIDLHNLDASYEPLKDGDDAPTD